MFTGLIEEVGTIVAVKIRKGNKLLTIAAPVICEDIKPGDSIAVSGPCLTVIAANNSRFQVEATEHTAASTNIAVWQTGRSVNLERALKVGDRFGGHMVQGHVDGRGTVAKVRYMAGSNEYFVEVPRSVRNLIAAKGSIAIDGVSLTIASLATRGFSVMVIPFTLEKTTLGTLKPGDPVNIETDIIFRWLAERYTPINNEDSADSLDETFSMLTDIYKED